jgi:hypothetical protein
MKRRIITFSAASLAGLSLINCPSAHSQTINLLIDPATNNACAVMELVTAIKTVRDSGAPGTINTVSNALYTLTEPDNWEYGPNGLPQISGDITINGQGATIQRATDAPKFRLLYVSGGLSYETNTGVGLAAGSLTLTNLTLTGGLAEGGNGAGGGGGMGGAIFNQGTLVLDDVTLIDNTALGGNTGGAGDGGAGGGGMGSDSDTNGNGGGFGGPFLGRGGSGSAGTTNNGISGGGGGFRPYDNSPGIDGGGFGSLGGGGFYTPGPGDGGNGGELYAFSSAPGLAGGDFGCGGQGGIDTNPYPDIMCGSGGGGGVGGGGGHFGNFSGDGDGGFGGGGGGFGEEGGQGGFGGGGGGWDAPGGFAGGYSCVMTDVGGGGGGLGGAIFNHRGLLFLTNCIITANTAQGGDSDAYGGYSEMPGGGSGYGGGLFNLNGTVTLVCCTLSSNIVVGGFDVTEYGEHGEYLGQVTGGDADGGALYNLAFGNKIEDGTVSIATVTLVNTILTNSIAGPLVSVLYTNDSSELITNVVVPNDLVNNEVNGNQTNIATIIFSTNSPAIIHIDLAQAKSITAATHSQAALLSAPTLSGDPVFQFNVIGVPGYNYVVQASTNMTDWCSVQTNVCPFVFQDTNSTNYPARFYRAIYQP